MLVEDQRDAVATQTESDPVQAYFNDMYDIPLLDREQEVEITTAMFRLKEELRERGAARADEGADQCAVELTGRART